MENLLRIFNQSDGEDRRLAALSWATYSILTAKIAKEFGFEASIGAAVFAALSPNNDYLGNVRDTRRLLEGVKLGRTPGEISVSTYHNNKHKAYRIAQGEDPLSLLLFPKTRSFYLNISDPTDPYPVTVDGHIFNAWLGQRRPLKDTAQKMNRKHYEVVAEDVRRVGKQVGLIPNQVQAVIWHVWRRLHNIRGSAQMTLWSEEARASGLDFHPYFEPLPQSQ